MQIDHNEISQIMREVAADKIIPRFQKLADGEIRTKSGPEDLVTIADEEAEVEITKRLQAAYPGCYVLGEESVAQGTVSRDILKTSNTLIFIVDPVDGTRNFAHGVPRYGSIVAAVYNGECIGGWIYQIPLDRIFHAEKGKGVMIDGVPFTPAAQPAPDADFSVMRAFISTMFVPSAYRPMVEEKAKMLASADTYMCCAWEYPALLEGEAVFSLYTRIEPWDHLAGALLLTEAGFHVRKWDGSPYQGDDLKGGVVNAPSPQLWDRVYEAFLKDALTP
ncbi:MAG: inositol monophosphatase [Alphaproteobacteria bacterium]|nr:inositol monophosphatase [Alphaproteobacteria bacterium]